MGLSHAFGFLTPSLCGLGMCGLPQGTSCFMCVTCAWEGSSGNLGQYHVLSGRSTAYTQSLSYPRVWVLPGAPQIGGALLITLMLSLYVSEAGTASNRLS